MSEVHIYGEKFSIFLSLLVYYPARKAIEEAMEDWEKYTCTRFIQGESPMGHYIRIFAGSGYVQGNICAITFLNFMLKLF